MKAVTLSKSKSSLIAGLLTIVLLAGCDNAKQDTSEAIQLHQKRSEAYEKNGQYKAAIIEAKNIIKKAPQNPLGYLQLANIFLALDNGKAAIDLLEPLIAEDTPASTHLKLAKAYTKYGKYFSADKSLSKYLNSGGDSSNIDYQLLKIKSLSGRNQIKPAISQLKQIIQEKPDELEAQTLLAKLYYSQQQFNQSRQLISDILQKDSQKTEALYLSAQLAYLQNDLDTSEKQLTNALITLPESDTIKPLRARILTQLSTVLTEQGRTTEALIYSKLLASENPESQEAKSKLTEALKLLQTNNTENAEKLLIELNEQYPNHDPSAIYLGLVNFQKGKLENADILLSSHIDPENASPKLIETTALTKIKLNKIAEATDILEQALRSHPNNEHLLTLYGSIALKNNQEKAVIALEKAVAINPDKTQTRLLLAQHYIKNNKETLGIAHLEQSLKKSPDDVSTVALYSQTMLKTDQKAKADQAIKQLLTLAPDNVDAINLSARYALLSKETRLATERFNETLRIQPGNLQALSSLANIAIKAGKIETALKHYQQLITADPTAATGYKGLVTAYELKKAPEQGLDALKQYITQYRDKTATPAYVIAQYYALNNNFDRALSYFNDASKQDQNSTLRSSLGANIYFLKATQSFREKNYEATRKALIKGAQFSPSNLQMLSLLAETEIRDKRPEEARKIITEINKTEPNTALANNLNGLLAIHNNDFAAASKAYQAAWAIQPNDRTAQRLYNSLKKAKQPAQASALLTEWSQTLPDSNQAKILQAVELQAKGEYQQAISLYEPIIEKDANNPAVLNNLAWLYLSTKDERAIKTAEKAYQLAPKSYAILDTYGWILFKTGNTNKAIELLQEAANIAPENEEIQKHLVTAKATL